ncbi:MAG: hypothetical protein U0794_20415 [Isosphaeraceae bacterium]
MTPADLPASFDVGGVVSAGQKLPKPGKECPLEAVTWAAPPVIAAQVASWRLDLFVEVVDDPRQVWVETVGDPRGTDAASASVQPT